MSLTKELTKVAFEVFNTLEKIELIEFTKTMSSGVTIQEKVIEELPLPESFEKFCWYFSNDFKKPEGGFSNFHDETTFYLISCKRSNGKRWQPTRLTLSVASGMYDLLIASNKRNSEENT